MIYQNQTNGAAGEDFTYFNAIYTVENALSKVKDEKGMKRVEKFLHETVCPDCGGTRLSKKVLSTKLADKNLAEATAMTLNALILWVKAVPETLPDKMRPMAEIIIQSFLDNAKRLNDLGLSYLSLDRASSTLSTGERQRVQLARAVCNETTGVLYVLDEPSIGLHPSNIDGLMEVVDSLIADGNSVILVDHDVRVLKRADYMIELGPLAGSDGGTIIAQGTVDEVAKTSSSKIAPFITDEANVLTRKRAGKNEIFSLGTIYMETAPLHTVHELNVKFPKGRLITITGVSGSEKTTMILENLIPSITAYINNQKLPPHIRKLQAEGIHRVNLIDSSLIGINIRSTIATYSGILDDLRKLYAQTDSAKKQKLNAGAFSYNTGSLRCATCDETWQISLDVQFLPDVTITYPTCGGKRYSLAILPLWTLQVLLVQMLQLHQRSASDRYG
ncbi:MAG: ATP-binding cassette domain-containing protein [Synergistaceae bacterium]|nr:ATP-binding cassette domain-containing protein [Synergistaceae bacterium]